MYLHPSNRYIRFIFFRLGRGLEFVLRAFGGRMMSSPESNLRITHRIHIENNNNFSCLQNDCATHPERKKLVAASVNTVLHLTANGRDICIVILSFFFPILIYFLFYVEVKLIISTCKKCFISQEVTLCRRLVFDLPKSRNLSRDASNQPAINMCLRIYCMVSDDLQHIFSEN